MNNSSMEPDWPFISVVMPVRNEAAFIARSLTAVLNQDYPRERYEVLIADGMSTDDTRQIITRLSSGGKTRIVDNPGRIVPTGLNAAIREAAGEVIVRVDGHCVVAPDYVRTCVRLISEHGCAAVGGPIETVGETYMSWAIAAAMSSPFGVGGSAFRTIQDRELWTDTVPFPAYPRTVIESVGLFDEELVRNQDDEYNARVRRHGGRILLSPEVRSRYFSRTSLSSLVRQYYQYGYWKVRVLQKHPRQMCWRHFVPPVFLLTLMALAVTSMVSAAARWLLLSVLCSYGLLLLAGALWTASRFGWRYLPCLPLVFAGLHLSYGAGFLAGLIAFRDRWRDREGQVPRFD